MAEHVHKTYTCDRCKASMTERKPPHPWGTVQIRGYFEYREGPGPKFTWNDLCQPCGDVVTAFFKAT